MDVSKKRRRRGRDKLPADEKRDHCVSVRLNKKELSWLDQNRKKYKRGEYLRMASLDKLPKIVPKINRSTWIELGAIGNNLNQISRKLNSDQFLLIDDFVDNVSNLRDALLGIEKYIEEDL